MSEHLTDDGARVGLTEQELGYLQQFLDAGDRGGFYMAYFNMVSSDDTLLVSSELGKQLHLGRGIIRDVAVDTLVRLAFGSDSGLTTERN